MSVNFIQGIYFLVTGLWPVFNISSFEKVSGPKTDKWLVKTFGLLVAGTGIVLIVAKDSPKLLGILSALALGLTDIYYSLKGRISKTYLLDAVAEVIFVALWVANI
jgi:hypothetical protein